MQCEFCEAGVIYRSNRETNQNSLLSAETFQTRVVTLERELARAGLCIERELADSDSRAPVFLIKVEILEYSQIAGTFKKKRLWSLPWTTRAIPSGGLAELIRRWNNDLPRRHLIIMVANHFEPSWSYHGLLRSLDKQIQKLDKWCEMALQKPAS